MSEMCMPTSSNYSYTALPWSPQRSHFHHCSVEAVYSDWLKPVAAPLSQTFAHVQPETKYHKGYIEFCLNSLTIFIHVKKSFSRQLTIL